MWFVHLCISIFVFVYVCVCQSSEKFDFTSSLLGVKRVQRNFVDELWLESQVFVFAPEMETKTAAEELLIKILRNGHKKLLLRND